LRTCSSRSAAPAPLATTPTGTPRPAACGACPARTPTSWGAPSASAAPTAPTAGTRPTSAHDSLRAPVRTVAPKSSKPQLSSLTAGPIV
jgi:hypothetical protein